MWAYKSHEPTITLSFVPLVPVREDIASEVVYIKRWQKLHGGATSTFDVADLHDGGDITKLPPIFEIMYDFIGLPTERDCRIASGFMLMMGQADGRDMSFKAEKRFRRWQELHESRGERQPVWGAPNDVIETLSDAFVLEWHRRNKRDRILSSGYTLAEQLATPMLGKRDYQQPDRDAPVELMARDLEVMALCAYWMGTARGQDYIAGCERNLAIKREREQALRIPGRPGLSKRQQAVSTLTIMG